MTDDLASFVDTQYRKDFENGRLKAGYEAALFCIKNGVPIPSWLSELVESAIKRDFISSERRGRGKAAPIIESRRAALSSAIYYEVERLRTLGHTQRDAFAMVANDFWQNIPDGKLWTADGVKNHYIRYRRNLK